MGIFSKHKEYVFSDFGELIDSIIQEFDDGGDIRIVVPYDEVIDIVSALISTKKFVPCLLDYCASNIDGYVYEYSISLSHFDGDSLWVEPMYLVDCDKYKGGSGELDDVLFVSDSISKKCYDYLLEDSENTVLYSIKE